ncbi:MAG TPA: Rpn family recombination-promoting nuclease/putative transposase [Pirellulales bacterium]|nr:Rpn family recombination-promoting nuclease/putative transposase [Pirellulales bacterium]
MKPQCDPKVDYAFKHVFGREQNKPILTSLIDAVLQPAAGQQIESLDLLNPFNDKEDLDDKLSILDIKARDESGRQFNIEMQMLAFGAFRQRALYYWARLHQAQLQEGKKYRDLRPTIAICFLDTPLFPDLSDHHLIFELRERHHHTLFTDQLAMHILELPKFDKAIDELTTPLDRWLFFLRHAEELDLDRLPAALDFAEIRLAVGDLMMITQTELERERYESRLKAQRDFYAALEDATEKGLSEGREKGIAEGREQGRQEGRAEGQIARIHSFQRLLHRDLTAIEKLQSLPPQELDSLAARLEAELNAKLKNGSDRDTGS